MAIEIFFSAVSAISSVTQLLMKQEERLERFKNRFPELRSTAKRTDLPSDYLSLIEELNKDAQEVGTDAFSSPRWSVESNPILVTVARQIPDPILEAMKNNVYRCWTRLEHFISDNRYTPEERTRAHVLARQCVCDELQELLKYLGKLPDDLQGFWNACNCPTPLEELNVRK